jgi:hypothetical protein
MLSADENENRPIGKVDKRKPKADQPGKKSEPRKRKEAKSPASKPDQLLDALQRASTHVEESVSEPTPEEISAPVFSAESSAQETPLPEMSPIAATEAAKTAPVSLQTIANAYGDYSKKSFEQTSAFVAKLAGAGSLGKAFELQTAFAREAYETFVAESCRIRELHDELAKQRLARLEGLVSKMTQGAFNPTRKA